MRHRGAVAQLVAALLVLTWQSAAGADVYADQVALYAPSYSGGPVPTNPNFVDPSKALGAPDYCCNADGTGAVSTGRGGLLELRFVDNVLTTSGGVDPDLGIFEVGQVESYYVAVRPSNPTTRTLVMPWCVDDRVPFSDGYCELPGAYSGPVQIDLDAIFPGFAPGELRFDEVQLLDDYATGPSTGDRVGADFDAVEALQSGSAPICGDGYIEGAEQCDDGDTSAGDGCSSTCQLETCWVCTGEPSSCMVAPPGSPCQDGEPCTSNDTCSGLVCVGGPPPSCDDANPCTNDTCVTHVGCNHAANSAPCDDGSSCSINDHCANSACVGDAVMASGCRQAQLDTLLRMHDRADDTLDSGLWKWPHGAATSLDDFGGPISGTGGYELCIFAGATPALRVSARVAKGGVCGTRPCWTMRGTKSFVYKNLQAPTGIRGVVFKAGPDGKAKVLVKARGPALRMPSLDLALPVTAQFKDDTTGTCWEATYVDPIIRTAERFKAKQ